VIQQTRTGIGVGATIGGAIGGFVGAWGGPVGIGVGATIGGFIGGFVGNSLSEGGARQLQASYPHPAYKTSEGQKGFRLTKGTPLFHGTRWSTGNPKWWETSTPDKTGEDGGISFALDPAETPKIKNAQIILEYKLRKDIQVTGCPNKGAFHSILTKDNKAVCYTTKETEIVFHPNNLDSCVEFVYAHEAKKDQLLEVVVVK
jgi:hypothetical protein